MCSMATKTDEQTLTDVFLALADHTRLEIVRLIGNSEVSVSRLCEALGESQPKISRHLAMLRSFGLVNTRRDGRSIHYSLVSPVNPAAKAILDIAANGTSAASDTDDAVTSKQHTYAETDISTPALNDIEIFLL